MTARNLLNIPWRLLKWTFYGVFLGVVLFFALTRTEVGRDGLRQQLQSQFRAAFNGELHIGTLRGNLVNDLYASDVRILDDQGRLFATVDSVVARPRWTALVGQEVDLRSLTLFQPHVELHRRADSTWNAGRIFRQTGPQEGGLLSGFTFVNLRVENGLITTQNDAARPPLVKRNWLFDYTSTAVRNLRARLTVEWTEENRQIDILDITGAWEDAPIDLRQLQGQVLRTADGWQLNQGRLALGQTRLAFDAGYRPNARSTRFNPEIALTFSESEIQFSELQAVVPRLPLREAASVSGQIQGPLDGLLIQSLSLAHEASRVETSGTIFGLPDTFDAELDVADSVVDPADLNRLWPNHPLPQLTHLGPVEIDLYLRGTAPLSKNADAPRLQARAEWTLQNDRAGTIQGTGRLADSTQAVHYTSRLQVDSLDVGAVLQQSRYRSRLNGRARLQGQGQTWDALTADVAAALSNSSLSGRPLDSLHVAGQAEQGLLSVQADLWPTMQQRVHLEGMLNMQSAIPAYRLAGRTERLNLAALPLLDAAESDLSTRLRLQGEGRPWASLSGRARLAFDSSYVRTNGQRQFIPPNETTVRLDARGADGPRLVVEGDLLTLEAQGDVAVEPVWALGKLWGRAAAQAARKAWDKPAPQPLASAADGPPAMAAGSRRSVPLLQRRARRALTQANLAGVQLTTQFTLRRADILETLIPGFPALRTDATGTLHVQANADRIETRGTLSGDSLSARAFRADSMAVNFDARGNLSGPLRETLQAEVQYTGHRAEAGGLVLPRPTLSLSYDDAAGTLRFTSAAHDRTGPFRIGATLDVLPDRNEFTFDEVLLTVGQYRWQTTQPGLVNAYSDALVIPDFTLISPQANTQHIQQLRLRGTLSAMSRDTLFLDTRDVLLRPLSDLVQQKRPLSGVINGQLAFAGSTLRDPRLSSDLDVGWLALEDRLLGHFSLGSSYDPATNEVSLDAALRPTGAALATRPAYLETPVQVSEENDLTMRGTIGLNEGRSTSPPAYPLNLDVDIERADLFFFEFIFNEILAEVSGQVNGTGEIRGSFFDPTFDADLQIVDGRFDLPRFNLTYDIEGPVRVDREGIRIERANLSSPQGGTAVIDGTLLFNEYRFFSFDLTAELDELQIIDVRQSQDLPFYGTIWASGPLSLTGPLSDATLRSSDARTTPDSELYIPVSEGELAEDSGFILFADSTGQFPDLNRITQRQNVLDDRPEGEPSFLEGLELDLNINAPEGSTIHLVFDPLAGDVVTAIGSGRVQFQRQEGEFLTYGSLQVTSGNYLFTAGEVFVRRFNIDSGTITWDGDPTNARLNLEASYRTRASTSGLPAGFEQVGRIPLVVRLGITNRVESPRVDLSLAVDRQDESLFVSQTLDAVLNQPGLATEYATSVLLTNTFLLTTSAAADASAGAGESGSRLASASNQLAFNSVSQLVASQLNRYLDEALPNLDINLGVQGEDPQDLDLIYGVALRLLNERLVIRGEGVYQGNEEQRQRTQGFESEFVVEVRLSRNVSLEVFYRRSGNELLNSQTLTSTTGAGISYQTEFANWGRLRQRLFGWITPDEDESAAPDAAPADSLEAPPALSPPAAEEQQQ